MPFVEKRYPFASYDISVENVAPAGIEPASSESESEILSIEIRSHIANSL